MVEVALGKFLFADLIILQVKFKFAIGLVISKGCTSNIF